MKLTAMLLALATLPAIANAFQMLEKPHVEVCARLSQGPISQSPDRAYVAFGAKSADYDFSGLVEVAVDKDGNPIPDQKNHVVLAVLSIREISSDGSVSYSVPDVLDFKFKDGSGTFRLEPDEAIKKQFPNAPLDKIESAITMIFPIANCLNESQLDWRKW